jgi:lysine-specific demethylase/histidyl-hydroxylase NO66
LRHPGFRLVKAGEQLALADYTVDLPWRPVPFSGTAEAERVAAEFEAGATIVLQGLHLTWEPLAVFCRELEHELGLPVQANAYYTPRDSKGLPVHHDTHDVLSLQVSGEKRWLVYEPVWPLPLKEQRYQPSMGEPGEPVEDVVLKPGDTLYLPRGWLHEAVTSGTDSLHITVGVSVYTWLDTFKAALAECAGDVQFRQTPTGEADELLERLRERLAPDAIESRRRQRLVRTRRPLRSDQFDQLRALERLTAETIVERRRSVIADLRSSGDRLVLAFEGKEIAFPAHVESEVRFAAAAEEPFSPAELPGDLDQEGRLVLVRRLVREGFLRIREPGGPSPRSDGHAGALPPRT